MKQRNIETAVRHLKRGGLIVYPTETAYAFGCGIEYNNALTRVMGLKGRARSKTFPLIANDIHIAERYAIFNAPARMLALGYWPGPLTLVLPARRKLSPCVVNNRGEIAIRVSSNSTARALARGLTCPIIATSANRSGRPPCYSLNAVRKQFGMKRLRGVLLIDGGRLPRRKTSTIVRVTDSTLEVLREGAIALKRET